MRGMQQVLTAEQGNHVTVPTMIFVGREGPHFSSSHNELLVVELTMGNIPVRWILIHNGSSGSTKSLKHQGREIIPLVHPILGFGGQKVHPTGVFRLPLWVEDKSKVRNLKVDFLAVVFLTTYIVILGRPTLHMRMMLVFGNSKEISRRLGSATLSLSSRWWNALTKSSGLRFPPRLRPSPSVP
ncbi:hypothetical protein Cgig2_007773 [Carnegiea gigantea]|uniref:Uncharacterized protein n=1 Tax=Carnegiea gigantea TaxID=171969 RepID=A0A9Q1JK19_9CARY|nr:hypothetical protein Cgig2_007773 [Carnegiea gigantea]